MPLKTVVPIAAACFISGWLLASLLTPPVAELQALPERAQPRATTSEAEPPVPYTEQLHIRLQRGPLAPVPRRNPFVFAQRPRAAAPAPAVSGAAPQETVTPFAPIASGPALALAGIGESATPEGIVRTAIMSDGRTVHLAKVGEVVNGYAVVDITENSVIVGDAAGARWTFRLK